MTKPLGPINAAARAQAAREYLCLSKAELARHLRLGAGAGRNTVARIESGNQRPPGPYQVALEAFVAGFRPAGVTFPIDKDTTNGQA